jgi:hypothetical protein
MKSHDLMVEIAKKFVGVEETGPNKGPMIELFQAIDGQKARGQAYCADFVRYVAKQVDTQMRTEDPNWRGNMLAKTESAVNLVDMSPNGIRRDSAQLGFVVVWRDWVRTKDGQWFATSLGHCGIVCSIDEASGTMETCEANTSGPKKKGIVREGDGVYLKTRHLKADEGSMRIYRFVDPWGLASPQL